MYCIVFIAIFAFAATVNGEDIKKCRHFINPRVMKCCTKIPMDEESNNDLVECFKLPIETKDPIVCTREICIGTMRGYALPDGTFNRTTFKERALKAYEEVPEILEAIKVNCIDGDLDSFGTPEFCELIKMRNCQSVQFITNCPNWSDEGDCKEIMESVEECLKF